MYRHIFVAVDESPTSENALDEAIHLAKSVGALLEIVHVIDQQVLHVFHEGGVKTVTTRELERALEGGGKDILSQAEEKAREAGVDFRTRLARGRGDPVDELIAQALEDSGADLLIVGSHGRRGFRRLLLGSVAENLARKVSIPMMIVRGGSGEKTKGRKNR